MIGLGLPLLLIIGIVVVVIVRRSHHGGPSGEHPTGDLRRTAELAFLAVLCVIATVSRDSSPARSMRSPECRWTATSPARHGLWPSP